MPPRTEPVAPEPTGRINDHGKGIALEERNKQTAGHLLLAAKVLAKIHPSHGIQWLLLAADVLAAIQEPYVNVDGHDKQSAVTAAVNTDELAARSRVATDPSDDVDEYHWFNYDRAIRRTTNSRMESIESMENKEATLAVAIKAREAKAKQMIDELLASAAADTEDYDLGDPLADIVPPKLLLQATYKGKVGIGARNQIEKTKAATREMHTRKAWESLKPGEEHDLNETEYHVFGTLFRDLKSLPEPLLSIKSINKTKNDGKITKGMEMEKWPRKSSDFFVKDWLSLAENDMPKADEKTLKDYIRSMDGRCGLVPLVSRPKRVKIKPSADCAPKTAPQKFEKTTDHGGDSAKKPLIVQKEAEGGVVAVESSKSATEPVRERKAPEEEKQQAEDTNAVRAARLSNRNLKKS